MGRFSFNTWHFINLIVDKRIYFEKIHCQSCESIVHQMSHYPCAWIAWKRLVLRKGSCQKYICFEWLTMHFLKLEESGQFKYSIEKGSLSLLDDLCKICFGDLPSFLLPILHNFINCFCVSELFDLVLFMHVYAKGKEATAIRSKFMVKDTVLSPNIYLLWYLYLFIRSGSIANNALDSLQIWPKKWSWSGIGLVLFLVPIKFHDPLQVVENFFKSQGLVWRLRHEHDE